MVVVLLLAGVARSGALIVDQKCPQADDKNPGTLASPFKTIQAAMDKAQPGDTVQVRGGVYQQCVRFKRGGSYYHGSTFGQGSLSDVQWLALEAYKDEHVVLDGAVVIPADKWQLVEGARTPTGRPSPRPPMTTARSTRCFATERRSCRRSRTSRRELLADLRNGVQHRPGHAG